MKLNRMLVVLSANLTTETDAANMVRTGRLHDQLINRNYTFDAAVGCYLGTVEDSFVAQVESFTGVGELADLAASWGQESILIVDSRNIAFLYYIQTKHIERLGWLYSQVVGDEVTETPSAYTLLAGVRYYTQL